jgi:FdhE protein
VAAEFLRRLLGRSPSPGQDVQAALDDLDQLARERPSLAGPAVLLKAILPILYDGPSDETLPAMSPDHAATKLAGGMPLLRGENVSVGGKALDGRWRRICAMIQRYQNDDMGRALEENVRRGRLKLNDLAASALAGRPEDVHAQAQTLGLDPAMTAMVLRLTLMPPLAGINAALEPLRAGIPWERGACPTCGSWPLLGEYRGLEQTRWLRCGLCTAEWSFPRLRCPYCSTTDHHVLGFFSVEGEEGKYRAGTCDSCRGYVKMISTLGALDGPHLLVADLATLYLDLAAGQRSYSTVPLIL